MRTRWFVSGLHATALACLILALIFYAATWMPGAAALGFLGLGCELAFWILFWRAERRR